ncbi:hypothetical protein GGG16DRAFT_106873, partial [Schizophyllum commune]
MTQTPNLKIAAGMSREEMDMIIQYLSQQRAALGGSDSGHTSAVDNPSEKQSKKASPAGKKSGHDPDGQGGHIDKRGGRSSTVVDPSTPRKKFVPRPVQKKGSAVGVEKDKYPSTPVKTGASTPSSVTPSSKMAQLDLDGNKTVEASLGSKKGRATLVPTRPKVALPNGYDALLTYEEPVAPSKTVVTDPGPSDDDMFPENPGDTLPTTSGDTVKRDGDSAEHVEPHKHSSRGWINTRRTKSNDDPTPPPDEPWARKNRRRRSPSPVPAPTPSPAKRSPKKKARVASPEESPVDARIQELQRELAEAREQIKLTSRRRGSRTRPSASFVDDEAEESDMDGRRRDDPDLDNFVVDDDVIEYDDEVPALPDDEPDSSRHPKLTRLHRRTVDDDGNDGSDDDVEIVP